MSRGGTARGKINNFFKPLDVLSLKKGAFMHPLPGKILIFFRYFARSPLFKITNLICGFMTIVIDKSNFVKFLFPLIKQLCG